MGICRRVVPEVRMNIGILKGAANKTGQTSVGRTHLALAASDTTRQEHHL